MSPQHYFYCSNCQDNKKVIRLQIGKVVEEFTCSGCDTKLIQCTACPRLVMQHRAYHFIHGSPPYCTRLCYVQSA